MKEALFWEPAEGGAVRCRLCPHRCLVAGGKRGLCGVRENREGKLASLSWGRLAAAHVDPVEKKPLFHFLPGSGIFSVATPGCNFRCAHCQNSDLSQAPRERGVVPGRETDPGEIVDRAAAAGCRSIAFTYSEPTVFYEYARDIAAPARERGLRTVFVTNGYIEPAPLRAIAPLLDAANIDLKAFSEDFYRRVCGARLKPVLDSLALYRELGIWVEITTLVIPGLNDSERELRDIARFIAGLGREIPWHVSRFHPDYRLTDRPATPLETVRRAWEIGRGEGLLHVYQGNVPGGRGEDTLCSSCGRTVIARDGFTLVEYRLEKGRCSSCGAAVAGIWE